MTFNATEFAGNWLKASNYSNPTLRSQKHMDHWGIFYFNDNSGHTCWTRSNQIRQAKQQKDDVVKLLQAIR